MYLRNKIVREFANVTWDITNVKIRTRVDTNSSCLKERESNEIAIEYGQDFSEYSKYL